MCRRKNLRSRLAEASLLSKGLDGQTSPLIRAVRSENFNAREAMVLGTTLDCLPVTRFEGEKIADGKVGPVSHELLKLLKADIHAGPLVIDLN